MIFSSYIQGLLLFSIFLHKKASADSFPSKYNLPALSDSFPPVKNVFSCDGLKYGYYADVTNDCRIYHVCSPYITHDHFKVTRMFSFVCSPGTVFNQASLVCTRPENSIPCERSTDFYKINDYFGQTKVNFRE